MGKDIVNGAGITKQSPAADEKERGEHDPKCKYNAEVVDQNQIEKEIMNTLSFTTTSVKTVSWKKNIIKEAKEFSNEKIKSLKNELEQDTRKWKDFPRLMIRQN